MCLDSCYAGALHQFPMGMMGLFRFVILLAM